jgi:MFS family permease
MSGLSPASKKAVIATMVISLVLLFASMTAPLLSYIGYAYPNDNPYLIVQIPAFVGMLVSFAVGPLAMKVNLKWLMVASAVTAFIYFAIFALVGSNGPFIALVIGAGIVGVCQGAAMVLTSSIFGAYVVDPLQRANFVAISGALMNGGAAVVNVVGGIIAAGGTPAGSNWPIAYYLGILILPALIVFFIMMPMRPDAPGEAGGEGGPGGPPAATGFIPVRVFLIIGLGLIVTLGMAVFLLNVGMYIEGELGASGLLKGLSGENASSTDAGLANSLFTIFGVIAGFSFPVIVKFLKAWIAPIGYFIGGLGLFVLVFMKTSIIGVLAGACLCGLGFNIAMPFVMGQILALTPPRWVPVAMSINMGIMNLMFTFVPNIMGGLGGLFDGTLATQILIGGVFVMVAVVLAVFLFVFAKAPAQED